MTVRGASSALTVLACLLALAAVLTFLVGFERMENASGSLGLAAFGVSVLVLVLRRVDA